MDNQYSNNNNNIFQEVDKKASIVDVISYYLGAKEVIKKGRRYVCRCPFHDDHSPSMSIDPQRNIFKCFVDGKGGGPIKFVEEYEHIKAIDALKKVASICNIPLPNSYTNFKSVIPEVEQKYPEELKALQKCGELYSLNLISKDGKEAREYLEKRKIDQDVIKHFGLGFAFKNPETLIKMLRDNNGFDVKTLETAGILSPNSQSFTDRYVERIMFPIHDNFGHLVAFSGRKIRDDQNGGKYDNYRETELFKKSEVMYHFYLAKDEARKVKYIYLVEGYMDAIAYVRAGIKSVAALMGTALTSQNIETLKKLNVEVRLALDGDEAGRLGIERALVDLNKAHIPTRVQWKFNKAKDADELLTKFGKEVFIKEVNRLFDPVIFILGRRVGANGKLNDSNLVLSYLKEISPYFFALDPLTQNKDLKIISEKTRFDRDAILKVLNKNEDTLAKQEKIKKEEKIKSDREFVKDVRQRPYYPYYKKQVITNIDLSTLNLGFKYQQGNAILQIQNEILDYCKNKNIILPLINCVDQSLRNKKDYMKNLVTAEAELILVICQNRNAYKIFEDSNSSFIISPLYELCTILGSYFMEHNDKETLKKEDYQEILNKLNETETVEDKIEIENVESLNNDSNNINMDDDLFDQFNLSDLVSEPKKEVSNDDSFADLEDCFDIDDIKAEFETKKTTFSNMLEEDKELIIHILSTLYNLDFSLYDVSKYTSKITMHKKLIDMYNFLKDIVENKAGNMTTEDKIKFIKHVSSIQNV